MNIETIEQPLIETKRLLLRPFTLKDAERVQFLAGERAVAATVTSIPHPYPDGAAEEWIRSHPVDLASGSAVTFAIVLRAENALCGSITLRINQAHRFAEMGYWLGVPYWGQGYCSEAVEAVVEYAFKSLEMNRLYAQYLSANTASERVMQKIDMVHEGSLHQHAYKWGEYVNIEQYGLLRSEWLNSQRQGIGNDQQNNKWQTDAW